jgi:ketosteroid isomerase-like protein
VTLDELDRWLDSYGRAWERKDVDAFVACFDPDASYHWGPFGEPLRGHDEIRTRTEHAVSQQAEVAFRHEPLAVSEDGRGIAWWGVTYLVPARASRFRNEGIFLVALGPDGRCTEFREWWNERELP